MERFLFSQPDNAVLYDMELKQSIYRTYNILKSMANTKTNITPPISIAVLAKLLKRRLSTICTHLSSLVKMGIIKVIKRHDKSSKHWRLANKYLIIGRYAPRYQNSEFGPSANDVNVPALEENEIKMRGGYPIFRTTSTPEYLQELKETNIREAETSSVVFPMVEQPTMSYVEPEAPKVYEAPTKTTSETNCGKPEETVAEEKESIRPETTRSTLDTKKPEVDLSNVPDNLKPTARLLLGFSERTKLEEDEVKLLVLLLENHYQTRINREIEHQAERFKKMGRNVKCLTVFYIHSILQNQRSRPLPEDEIPTVETPAGALTDPRTEAIVRAVTQPARKKRARSNKKAAVRTPNTDSVVQGDNVVPSEPVVLSMPVAEAEKVIADYQTEHAKKPEPESVPAIPVALEELFNKMQARENERIDEYFEALPKDEYGDFVLPEDGGVSDMPIEDYLHLKYPEAEEEELCRDYGGHVYSSVREHPEAGRIQAAFEIDYACAMCMNPENCQLPEGVKKGQPKLVTKIFTCKDGKKCLGTGFEGRIKCKHNCPKPNEKTPEEKRQEAEFEHLMSYSGIVRKDKTFENYNAGVPELVVAEAMAILAVKTGKNLVLAGRAGTGKTHLATAIAIEVMKAGRQARVTTANEMLDRICQAYRDNADPLGVLLKYKRVPVLVIDDWDKAKMSDARLDYLYQIIDYRYERGLQTIVTTNAYSMNELKLPRWCNSSIEPIMSRLLENGDWVTIREAENYRLKKSAPAVSVPEVTPVAEEPAIELNEAVAEAEPEEPDRSGKISLTETTLPVDEEPARAEPETPSATLYSEAEVFAECERCV